MKKTKKSFKNIRAFFLGSLRYKIFYSPRFHILLRKYIKEQIEWRIFIMDEKCNSDGSCKMCGCTTTALQMANKACDKPCYPPMMNKHDWNCFKIVGTPKLGEVFSTKYVDKTEKILWVYEMHISKSNNVYHILKKDYIIVNTKIVK